MKRYHILFTIPIILTLTVVSVATPTIIGQQQSAFADKKALDEAGTICPPGHECHCTPASGVYHDTDPETGRTFNINNGCKDDTI